MPKRFIPPVAEFKEFERRFIFKPRLKSWLVPLKIVSNVSRFKPALNLNRVLADLNRGLNSLNSISGFKAEKIQVCGNISKITE